MVSRNYSGVLLEPGSLSSEREESILQVVCRRCVTSHLILLSWLPRLAHCPLRYKLMHLNLLGFLDYVIIVSLLRLVFVATMRSTGQLHLNNWNLFKSSS